MAVKMIPAGTAVAGTGTRLFIVSPVPSVPWTVDPVPYTAPFWVRTRVKYQPAAISTGGLSAGNDSVIGVGRSDSVLPPLPNWPKTFCPQAHTWPLDKTAAAWSRPRATSVTCPPPGHTTGPGTPVLPLRPRLMGFPQV